MSAGPDLWIRLHQESLPEPSLLPLLQAWSRPGPGLLQAWARPGAGLQEEEPAGLQEELQRRSSALQRQFPSQQQNDDVDLSGNERLLLNNGVFQTREMISNCLAAHEYE